jgi:hypothetical protein
MSNMIIKRWDTTLNNNAGGWKAISPKVTFNDIVADVTAVTPVSIFENNKLKIGYLPDAVFDSLLFFSTFDPSGTNAANEANIFAGTLEGAFLNAASLNRNVRGYYFVASAIGVLGQQTTGIQFNLSSEDPIPYIKWTFKIKDAGSATGVTDSGTMEAGDWLVIEEWTGSGTQGDPYFAKIAVVNNAYELMTGATTLANGAPGLVPQPLIANRLQFLRGDATWAAPTDTNTTYSIKAETVSGGADLDLDAGGSGSGTDTISFLGSGSTTVSATNANVITISSANTTYSVSAADHGSDAAQKYIRLTDSGSSTDDVSITAGSNMSISRNGDQIILAADAYSAGLGLEVSSKSFSMEYPIAVKTTSPAQEYQVANAIWFDLETL